MDRRRRYKKELIETIDGCVRKDLDAWNRFAELATPLMRHIVNARFERIGFNCQPSDLMNVAQEVLLSIWERGRLATLKDKENVIGWISAISANAASNYARTARHYDLSDPDLTNAQKRRGYPSLVDELSKNAIRSDVEEALKSLHHRERLVVKLSLIHKKKFKEIAHMLNMPIGTVLSIAARGRFKLRRLLKKYEKSMQ